MYEAYSDYQSMMNMTEEIVTRCALAVNGKLTIDYQVKCALVMSIVMNYNLSYLWHMLLGL